MKQHTNTLLGANATFNYKDWLLKSNKLFTELKQDEVKMNPILLKKADSFEDLSSNQGNAKIEDYRKLLHAISTKNRSFCVLKEIQAKLIDYNQISIEENELFFIFYY